jgi:hypothetical protein
MRSWSLSAVVLIAAGCSQSTGVQQSTLGAHEPHPSLVLGHRDAIDDMEGRKDPAGKPAQVYHGPGGKLYYQDGSAVPFDSVTKQLRDLRTEERISPIP